MKQVQVQVFRIIITKYLEQKYCNILNSFNLST